jgi:hypothetical protein
MPTQELDLVRHHTLEILTQETAEMVNWIVASLASWRTLDEARRWSVAATSFRRTLTAATRGNLTGRVDLRVDGPERTDQAHGPSIRRRNRGASEALSRHSTTRASSSWGISARG